MPGIKALGKLFFEKKCVPEKRRLCAGGVSQSRVPAPLLIVRKIIRLKSRRRSEHVVAVDHSAAVSARKDLVFVRRDDRSAA